MRRAPCTALLETRRDGSGAPRANPLRSAASQWYTWATMRSLSGILLSLLAFSAPVIAGCGGPDIGFICEEREACVGGNEADIAACIDQAELEIEIADIEGCEAEFDTYYLCFQDLAECDSQKIGACASDADCKLVGSNNCSNGQCEISAYMLTDNDDCEAERNAYEKCRN